MAEEEHEDCVASVDNLLKNHFDVTAGPIIENTHHIGKRIAGKPRHITLGSRFGFCVVSEHTQASRSVGIGRARSCDKVGKKQTWGSIFKSHIS